MQYTIAQFRAGCKLSLRLLWSLEMCCFVVANDTFPTWDYPRNDYVVEMYRLAAANNCGLIDIQKRWGGGSTYILDGLHPNVAGHLDMAKAVLGVILPPNIKLPQIAIGIQKTVDFQYS